MRLDRERLVDALLAADAVMGERHPYTFPLDLYDKAWNRYADAIADAYEATTESEGREVPFLSSRLPPRPRSAIPAARPRAGPRAAAPGGGIGARRRATHTRGRDMADIYISMDSSGSFGASVGSPRDAWLDIEDGRHTKVSVHIATAEQAAQLIEAATELHRRLLRAEAVGARG